MKLSIYSLLALRVGVIVAGLGCLASTTLAQIQVYIPPRTESVYVPGEMRRAWIPPVTQQVTTPAVYEDVTIPAVTQTVTIPAVTQAVTIPAVKQTVTIPAVTQTVTIPAVIGTREIPPEVATVHHDAVVEIIHHPAITATQYDYVEFDVWVGPQEYEYWVDGYYDYENPTEGNYVEGHYVTVYVEGYWTTEVVELSYQVEIQAAYDEEIVIEEAYDETVVVRDGYTETYEVEPAGTENVEVSPARTETIEISPARTETVEVSPARTETVVVTPARTERRLVQEERTVTVVVSEGRWDDVQDPGYFSEVTIPGRSIAVSPLSVVHPVSGPMEIGKQNSVGGYVALRRDETTPATILKIHALPDGGGGEFRLTWASQRIRIWRERERITSVLSGVTTFPTNTTTEVFVEGVEPSMQMMDVSVSLSVGGGNQDVRLTVVRAEFDVTVRTFIPYDWVKIIHPLALVPFVTGYKDVVAKGDNRGFDPSPSASYRMRQFAVMTPFVDLHSGHIKLVNGVEIAEKNCGETKHYFWKDSLTASAGLSDVTDHSGHQSASGQPGYLSSAAYADEWVGPAGGNFLKARDTAGTGGMNITKHIRSNAQTMIRFVGSAGEPLVSGSDTAGSIDYSILVEIDISNPVVPAFRISGDQDGFPGYEVYIKALPNGQLPLLSTTEAYQWVPPLSNNVLDLARWVSDTPINVSGLIK